jgi:hypothetical protein
MGIQINGNTDTISAIDGGLTVSDTTQLSFAPEPKEGVMYIYPSVLLHYAQSNASGKERVVTSWDMLVI